LLNFGKLNGQIGRRCLPVHFSRYRLEREADCLEFQSALVSLLEQVPLRCDVETLVGSYWVYFYEGCIGCIGVLKDWLMRAVSASLDAGQDRLSLDCLQDHIRPSDILRQMALDASEGEQKLENTQSNREHLWRILQGGELIAPIPPLPPRETREHTPLSMSDDPSQPPPSNSLEQRGTSAPAPSVPEPPVKKARSRKKVEATPLEPEPASVIQVSDTTREVAPKPARSRRKKTTEPAVEAAGIQGESSSSKTDNAPPEPPAVVAPAKPKRTRRVGEPKPKRYPVGEQETPPG
jgi:hypothetical protein